MQRAYILCESSRVSSGYNFPKKTFLPNESGCEPLVHCYEERSCHTLGICGPWSSEGWELLVVISWTNNVNEHAVAMLLCILSSISLFR